MASFRILENETKNNQPDTRKEQPSAKPLVGSQKFLKLAPHRVVAFGWIVVSPEAI
jgi:hypothetical protein